MAKKAVLAEEFPPDDRQHFFGKLESKGRVSWFGNPPARARGFRRADDMEIAVKRITALLRDGIVPETTADEKP
jgi:hypothetical protein